MKKREMSQEIIRLEAIKNELENKIRSLQWSNERLAGGHLALRSVLVVVGAYLNENNIMGTAEMERWTTEFSLAGFPGIHRSRKS